MKGRRQRRYGSLEQSKCPKSLQSGVESDLSSSHQSSCSDSVLPCDSKLEARRLTGSKDVADAWKHFEETYKRFREDNKLFNGNYNAFEICTALSDKHGRICRQIKHAEREDHKPDWPDGMTEAMSGYLVYTFMLLEKYGCNMEKGLRNELQSAVDQYSGSKER